MKKGAIFDMDGLLYDTERLYQESWAALAETFGLTHNPAFPPAVAGTGGRRMRQIIREYYPEVDAEAFIQSCVDRVNNILEEGVPEKPGVREILSYFRENGVRMAVASSSRMDNIRHHLRSAGIEGYFDAIASGQEVERSKPEPDIFLLAARRLELPPEDCYVFEDSVNGVCAGIAAGCAAVMIPDMTPPPAGLQAWGICASLTEARRLIAEGRL